MTVALRRAMFLAATVALVAGCRERPADTTPYTEEVERAVREIEKAVGVKFRTPPRLEVRSRDSVRAYLVREFERAEPAADLAGSEAAYRALGLIPDTMNLRRLLLDVLNEQVVGYYDPVTDVLYVVDGVPRDLVGFTITHELVHALQDQYLPLDSLQRMDGDDDRQSAAQAVIEGQAQYESTVIMAGGERNLGLLLPRGWEQLRDVIRDEVSGQPIFSAAPTMVKESLLFPYISGAEFVRRFKQHHPDRLPIDRLPTSTEQIMHEQAFFGDSADTPVRVVLPSVPGAIYENDLGEFGMRLFLYEHLRDQNASIRAAAGWDGDRYVVFRTASGNGIAVASVWDGPIDAAEYVTTLTDAMSARYRAPARSDAGGSRTITGRGHTVRIAQREVNGRNVVLFVDVPAGASPGVVDISRITLEP